LKMSNSNRIFKQPLPHGCRSCAELCKPLFIAGPCQKLAKC
jgi:pyruvate formate-lyase activating enzyme-like uncharacterized protein